MFNRGCWEIPNAAAVFQYLKPSHLFIVFTGIILCSTGCRPGIHSQSQANKDAKRMTKRKVGMLRRDSVCVATVPNTAEKSATAALDRAGIPNGSESSLATGIWVNKSDVPRAEAVLKADAQLNHYRL